MNWLLAFALLQCPPPIGRYPHLPPLDELRVFPDAEVAWTQMWRWAAVEKRLADQLPFHPHRRDEIQANILCARRQHVLWDTLRDAHSLYHEESRRDALAQLERLLGRERYLLGIMPPLLSAFDVPPEVPNEPEMQ